MAGKPDKDLLVYKDDYVWLCQVYESVKPSSSGPNIIWTILGPKTIELIHQNVTSIDIGDSIEDLVVDSHIVEECMKNDDVRKKVTRQIEKMLDDRLGPGLDVRHNPQLKEIIEKLKELREKMKLQQIESIEYLKHLLELAKEVIEAERVANQPANKRQQGRAALTDLFESIKTPETPFVVENVVNDIDNQVVSIVRRFNNAFKTVSGQTEVRKMLRSILWLKYKIKDNDVFEKAYKYVEMYYNEGV